jgi:hypothetical protein
MTPDIQHFIEQHGISQLEIDAFQHSLFTEIEKEKLELNRKEAMLNKFIDDFIVARHTSEGIKRAEEYLHKLKSESGGEINVQAYSESKLRDAELFKEMHLSPYSYKTGHELLREWVDIEKRKAAIQLLETYWDKLQ